MAAISRPPRRRRSAAEDFRLGRQLGVGFKADDDFVAVLGQSRQRPAVQDLSPVLPRRRPHVHDEYIGEKKIPLGIYCRKSLASHLDPDVIFKVTKQGFAYFEKVFGLAYPFDKYDQIAVVDYNWGAMENVGAVTFKEELFVYRSRVTERLYKYRANTILHEMSHMWFGNMVTYGVVE